MTNCRSAVRGSRWWHPLSSCSLTSSRSPVPTLGAASAEAGKRIQSSLRNGADIRARRDGRRLRRACARRGERARHPQAACARQVEFAGNFGFSPDAVQEWEAGRRMPDRSARVVREIVEHELEAARRRHGHHRRAMARCRGASRTWTAVAARRSSRAPCCSCRMTATS